MAFVKSLVGGAQSIICILIELIDEFIVNVCKTDPHEWIEIGLKMEILLL